MPLSLIVFSFISLLGTASAAALLARNLGLLTIVSPLVIWLMFLFFSLTGPLGILMAAQRPARLLMALGFTFILLGLAALTLIFTAAIGVIQLAPAMIELFVLSFLCLSGGLMMTAAGRSSPTPAANNK